MAGRGTGVPIAFRCWKCRRTHAAFEYMSGLSWMKSRDTHGLGLRNRVTLTGRKRDKPNWGNCPSRSTNTQREYRCLDCGHVGWSCHADLAKAERRA